MSGPAARSMHGRPARFRARRLAIASGGWLMLRGDDTIERTNAKGDIVERWPVDDPAWASHALRFGIRESPRTALPRGRDVPGSKPPV